MGFFRKMFGQGDADRDTGTIEPPAATPHRVGYDPKLIDALLLEQRLDSEENDLYPLYVAT